jgi:hypothetical protein
MLQTFLPILFLLLLENRAVAETRRAGPTGATSR